MNKIAYIATLIGVLLALFSASPDEWLANAGEWANVLAPLKKYSWLLVAFIFGAIANQLIIRFFRGTGDERTAVIGESQLSEKIRQIMSNETITEAKIFSYTGETLGDFISYQERYKKELTLKLLVRNWIDEGLDEAEFNENRLLTGRRNWDKSNNIEALSKSRWTYAGKREIRFYQQNHPLLRVIIFNGPEKRFCYLSLYEFQQSPGGGGSVFKGSNSTGIFLSSHSENEDRLIQRIESQFDFYWNFKSVSAEDVQSTGYESIFS